jgi:hypothetical protein
MKKCNAYVFSLIKDINLKFSDLLVSTKSNVLEQAPTAKSKKVCRTLMG